jgi:hypothetical protein
MVKFVCYDCGYTFTMGRGGRDMTGLQNIAKFLTCNCRGVNQGKMKLVYSPNKGDDYNGH